MTSSVAQQLHPKHLEAPQPSLPEMKAQATAAQEAALEKREDPRTAAMRQREYTFPFEYVDAQGKHYSGTFTNKVPDIRTRQQMGILRAQLAGGVPFETLDPFTRELNMVLAHLTYTLKDEGRPDWAKDFNALVDTGPLYKLWEEVALHEATFLGDRGPQASSAPER